MTLEPPILEALEAYVRSRRASALLFRRCLVAAVARDAALFRTLDAERDRLNVAALAALARVDALALNDGGTDP